MASKNVVWPHPTEPRARKHRRTKNDTFGGHIGKEPRLMNHTHTYIHIRSKVGSRKKTQHTHTCMEYTSEKKERREKLRKQEENMEKLLLEL